MHNKQGIEYFMGYNIPNGYKIKQKCADIIYMIIIFI